LGRGLCCGLWFVHESHVFETGNHIRLAQVNLGLGVTLGVVVKLDGAPRQSSLEPQASGVFGACFDCRQKARDGFDQGQFIIADLATLAHQWCAEN